jgi:type I restriction enzyme R subunit
MNSNEAFARAKIDALMKDVRWNLTDGKSVRFEYVLDGGLRIDYVLADRHGKSLAVIEAKRSSINPAEAADQALDYAKRLGVPFIFLTNGEEIRFWDYEREAHPRTVATFFSQVDLERRIAARSVRRDPLTIGIDGKVASRDYQHECIDTLCKEINNGRRKMLVEMATGTGKTRTAAAFIKRLFEAGVVGRVLFLVDRITLAKQTEDAFTENLPDYPAYILRSARGALDEKRITIATLQTMIGEYANFSSGYFDLVITDECHRSIYGKWSGALKHFDGIQVGLTATPCMANLDDMADEEDGKFVRDTLRFFEVKAPTFKYTIKQAIEDGYLVPYQIYKAKTVKTAAEGGFEVKRSELDWSAMDLATKAEFDELFGEDDSITVDPSALERTFTIPERNRAIVREYREVMDKGYTGKDGKRRAPLFGKTIVFAVTKRHAETLAQMFDAEFADKKPNAATRYADFVVSDMGNDSTVDAFTKIKRFKNEEFPKILVSVNMLDTGFDAPEVVNLVMARFTKSSILYQQMRGRGTRRADHIHKTCFTMFDFVGVTDFHNDDEDTHEGGFVVAKPPPDKDKTPRKLLMLDINDHIDPSTRDWVSVDEAGNIVRDSETDARAAKLSVAFEAWLANQSFNSDQMRLIRMIEQQIKADAADITEWEDWRFTNPPFSSVGGIQRARQTFGGAEGLDSLIASLNAGVFDAVTSVDSTSTRTTTQKD